MPDTRFTPTTDPDTGKKVMKKEREVRKKKKTRQFFRDEEHGFNDTAYK